MTDSQEEFVCCFVAFWCAQKKSLSKFIVKIAHVCQFSVSMANAFIFKLSPHKISFVEFRSTSINARLLLPFMGYVEIIPISIGIFKGDIVLLQYSAHDKLFSV